MQSGYDKFQWAIIYFVAILQVPTYSLVNYFFSIFSRNWCWLIFSLFKNNHYAHHFSCLLVPYLTSMILKGFILYYKIKQTMEHTVAPRPGGTAQFISTWQTFPLTH